MCLFRFSIKILSNPCIHSFIHSANGNVIDFSIALFIILNNRNTFHVNRIITRFGFCSLCFTPWHNRAIIAFPFKRFCYTFIDTKMIPSSLKIQIHRRLGGLNSEHNTHCLSLCVCVCMQSLKINAKEMGKIILKTGIIEKRSIGKHYRYFGCT